MIISAATNSLMKQLEEYSKQPLHCRDFLISIIEETNEKQTNSALDEIVFNAKALINIFQLMKKIGHNAEGYDKLEAEFSRIIKVIHSQILTLFRNKPEEFQRNLKETYLQQSQKSFQQFLLLCEDLRTYKNWKADTQK